MEQTAIKTNVQAPKLEAIRQQAKAIQKLYGGKLNFEEWSVREEDFYKVTIVWKWFRED
jgi:hypothetical protein